jgi:hypothetical protein
LDHVEFFHLFPYVALPEGHVDHRRLNVSMPHGLHDGKGISPSHSHLRAESMPEPVDVNAWYICPGEGTVQAIPNVG